MPMIPQIQKRDIILSYPFESIKPFLRLLNEAANDPSVVSIKITLYRKLAGKLHADRGKLLALFQQLRHDLAQVYVVHGVEQVDFKALSKDEESYLKAYFTAEILPLISPQHPQGCGHKESLRVS